MNLITRYLDEDQLKEYYSKKMEDSDILSDYIIYGDYEYNNLTNISELKKKFPQETMSYNFGDLIALSQYRDSKTYIITKNGNLIENPMDNRSGYLTIPYEITQYLDNATEKYKNVDVSELYLRHDDKFIISKIGIVDPKWRFEYVLRNDGYLSIKFPNNIYQEFNLDNAMSAEYIYNFYLNTLKKKTKFILKYKLENKKYDEFIDKYGDVFKKQDVHQLYWNAEFGSSGGGYKSQHGIMKYSGPSEYKKDVINLLERFYDGFDYEIIF